MLRDHAEKLGLQAEHADALVSHGRSDPSAALGGMLSSAVTAVTLADLGYGAPLDAGQVPWLVAQLVRLLGPSLGRIALHAQSDWAAPPPSTPPSPPTVGGSAALASGAAPTASAAASSAAAAVAFGPAVEFVACSSSWGARPGWEWRSGARGLGYYRCAEAAAAAAAPPPGMPASLSAAASAFSAAVERGAPSDGPREVKPKSMAASSSASQLSKLFDGSTSTYWQV